MPSIMQMLDDLVAEASKHPGAEELLSAIPTVAGAAMLARNGGNTRLGAPIGAGLTALGGMGLLKGARDESALAEDQQRKKMSESLKNAFPMTGPQPSFQQALPSLIEGGWSPEQAINLDKEMQPASGDMWWDTAANKWISVPQGTTPPPTATKNRPSEKEGGAEPKFSDFRAAHPELQLDDAIRQFKTLGRAPEKPEKPRYQIDTKDGKPVRVNIDTLEVTPIPDSEGLGKGLPKIEDAASVIEAEKAKSMSEWKANATYKTASGGMLAKLKGVDLDNPISFSNMKAAVALQNRKMLPPDIQAIDPKARFIGKLDKKGNPMYQTSKGTMASEAF